MEKIKEIVQEKTKLLLQIFDVEEGYDIEIKEDTLKGLYIDIIPQSEEVAKKLIGKGGKVADLCRAILKKVGNRYGSNIYYLIKKYNA